MGWFLADSLGDLGDLSPDVGSDAIKLPDGWPDTNTPILQAVWDYLKGGCEGSALDISRVLGRRPSEIRAALYNLLNWGAVTCTAPQTENRGRRPLTYCAVRGFPIEQFLAPSPSPNDDLLHRFAVARKLREYELRILEWDFSGRDPQAMDRLRNIVECEGRRPSTTASRAAFDLGLPHAVYTLVPLLRKAIWDQRDWRVIRAYGFAGELVRSLKTNPSLAFILGIDLWDVGKVIIGRHMHEGDYDWGVLYFERLLFQLAGLRYWWCEREEHRYFADYRRQRYCLAHSDSGRQADHRWVDGLTRLPSKK